MTAKSDALEKRMESALGDLRRYIIEAAQKENAYRKLKAERWIVVGTKELIAKAKEAVVDSDTADARQERDIALGMKQAAYEEIRMCETLVSLYQSELRVGG